MLVGISGELKYIFVFVLIIDRIIQDIISKTELFFNPTIFDSKGKQESPGEDWQDPAHRATVTCDG